MRNILKAIQLLPGYKRRLVSALGLGLITAVVVAAIPLAIQAVIDGLFRAVQQKEASIAIVLSPLLIWGALRLTLIVFEWWGEIIEDNLFKEAVTDFRRMISDKLSRLSITYFERNRAGEISSIANQSPFSLGDWLSNASRDYLAFILNALLAIAILAYKFPPIALVVFLIALLYSWFTFKTMAGNRTFWKNNRKTINEYSGVQVENISFITHIRSLGIEKKRNRMFLDLLDVHYKNLTNMFTFQHRRNFIASIIDLLLYAVPIAVFSVRALNGQQQPTDIYILSVYLGRISDASTRLARIWANTVETNDKIGDTLALLGNQDAVQDPLNPKKIGDIEALILNDVTFSYSSTKRPVLSNINLRIKKGQTVALVGKSGAGKSTIIKLLLRFYDPSSGSIILNDTDITDMKQEDVRQKFGVVMQDVALFNDTIGNNIAIARPGATKKEIEKAAKLAHANEFIDDLPEGYATIVGERGVKLSGGEKQRISIARAILRQPEIVLLDEATSALDSESEQFVQKGLKELMRNRTAIIIAHRLSTITHADIVLVLDKGMIVEEGTYEELKNAGGVFADLLARQQL